MRRYWLYANYLIAIALALIGWMAGLFRDFLGGLGLARRLAKLS
jgi:hypothetical protein